MERKAFFRIDTHLRSEYRWAFSSTQAALLVYREYRRHGLSMTFRECKKVWKAYRKVETKGTRQ